MIAGKRLFIEDDALRHDSTYPGIRGWWKETFLRDFNTDYQHNSTLVYEDQWGESIREIKLGFTTYVIGHSVDGYEVWKLYWFPRGRARLKAFRVKLPIRWLGSKRPRDLWVLGIGCANERHATDYALAQLSEKGYCITVMESTVTVALLFWHLRFRIYHSPQEGW